MKTEQINESVEIIATFGRAGNGRVVVRPRLMRWRGRDYPVDLLGLHYPAPRGRQFFHRFTFVIDERHFELEFNSQDLSWQLIAITDGSSA